MKSTELEPGEEGREEEREERGRGERSTGFFEVLDDRGGAAFPSPFFLSIFLFFLLFLLFSFFLLEGGGHTDGDGAILITR